MSIFRTLSVARSPTQAVAPVVDVAFALAGDVLPHDYALSLDDALVERLPWLADEPSAAIHPVRAPSTAYGLVLSRRSRLVLRVPEARIDEARALCGERLDLDGASLDVGAASARPVAPFATLRSWNVASSAEDEAGFLEDVKFQLEVLGVRANLICGRREAIGDARRGIAGFGLALHELSPAHSMLVQAHGLGPARRLGCGVFVHHKIIEGLGDEPD